MPPTLTYPGVYIEELPSAVHTITGVATSIAAFVGWAPQGPTGQASLVESWADYQTQFGGLDSRSYLGYSVNQFFANGGQLAYIVRLVWTDAKTATATVNVEFGKGTSSDSSFALKLYAANPGIWGNAIWVTITAPTNSLRFGLQVQVGGTLTDPNVGLVGGRVVENYVNLSVTPSDPQYVVTVINNDSQYLTFLDPDNPSAGLTGAISQLSASSAGVFPTTSGPTALGTGTGETAGLDGTVLAPGDDNFQTALIPDEQVDGTGVYLLDQVEIFNLLCVPAVAETSIETLQDYCASRRAMLIVDGPQTANLQDFPGNGPGGISTLQNAANSAYYFPWVMAADSLAGNRPRSMPPCGFVAGIYAATDASRGLWKAPAGIDTGLTGALGLQYDLTDTATGLLNAQGANCLRNFKAYGTVVWGARTLQGNDQFGSQWKYVPVRRLALFIESSLYDGTQWVVFEPNDETLWGQIRMNVGAFMQGLFAQGAFQGTTPQQAYFVKCDSENNPQSSINLGVVNVLVGFAPVYPAEFVVIQIQQIAGQV
jgi:phage tail sheath protein FI